MIEIKAIDNLKSSTNEFSTQLRIASSYYIMTVNPPNKLRSS